MTSGSRTKYATTHARKVAASSVPNKALCKLSTVSDKQRCLRKASKAGKTGKRLANVQANPSLLGGPMLSSVDPVF